MIAPDLAAQGEEITGMVVEDTDKGEVPLNEGDEVVFQGTVVPVGPQGKIKLPGFLKEVGNQFLVLQITRRAQGTPAKTATVSQHIEVLPLRQASQAVSTTVAQASQITTPGQPLRVTGQGLDKLQRASLVGQDAVEHQLGESVGSSLQRIYLGPKDLPKGNYQFVSQDANGKSYQAPDQCINPTVQITGTQIRRRGQRGQFTVSCNIEADIMLSGGEPQIQLDTNTVHVTPQAPGNVGFTAVQVGDYTLRSRVLNREEVPPDPQAPRVDAKPEPVQARYDPGRNQTNVSCPVNVVDQNGRPVANVPVDVAATHPNGVVYQRVNTDNRGRANFLHTFAGQLAANSVAVQAYRVLGRAWNKQAAPPEAPKPQQPQGPQPPVPQPPGAAGAPGQAPGQPPQPPQGPIVPPTGERPKPPVIPRLPQPEGPNVPSTEAHTKKCTLTDEILPGPGIVNVDAVNPKNEEFWNTSTNDPVPLIVTAEAMDQLLQTCTCLVDNVFKCNSYKTVDIVDPVSYTWLLARETGPSGRQGVLLGEGGPATLYQPPDMDVGQSDMATLVVEIRDSRGKEAREVNFTITTKREYVGLYKGSASVEISPSSGRNEKIPTEDCDCKPKEPQWDPGPAIKVIGTDRDLKVCAGALVILRASATDADTLMLECKGTCGNPTSKPTLPDETKYTWTAEKGKFPGYGYGAAKTNGWNTSVIYEAPEVPPDKDTVTDTVTVTVKDSGKQGKDAPVTGLKIGIEVYKNTPGFKIIGPDYVPGLSKYKYKLAIPAGKAPTDIKWTVDKPHALRAPFAFFEGATDQAEVMVNFENTDPDWIRLKATFKVDGKDGCAEKMIALVKVEVGAPTFTHPGKAYGRDGRTSLFLVDPPAPPAKETWVTTNDPGSAWAAFTYNGTKQAAEPSTYVNSEHGGSAYKAETNVKLISPAEKPEALQSIQVGYIQSDADSGSATYATAPAGSKRTYTVPTTETVDWLSSRTGPGATDEWPWYDKAYRATGSGTGTWNTTWTMTDSPRQLFPAQYNPNSATDPNRTGLLMTGAVTMAFVIHVAARTLDTDLGADEHYFDEGHSTWTVNAVWPVVPGVSFVTTGPAWSKPGSPSEINVNVVPAAVNANNPFRRFIP